MAQGDTNAKPSGEARPMKRYYGVIDYAAKGKTLRSTELETSGGVEDWAKEQMKTHGKENPRFQIWEVSSRPIWEILS